MQHFLSEDFSVLALQESIGAPTHHCWLIALDEGDRAVGFSKVNWSKPMPISGKAGARRFYEGFGFEVLGDIPFSTDKTEIGMVVMCCDISR